MRNCSLVSDLEGTSLLAHHASEDVSSDEGRLDHVADSCSAFLVLHAFSTILTLVEHSRDAFPGSHAFGSSNNSFAVGSSRLVEVGTSDEDGLTASKDDRLDHSSESLGLLFPKRNVSAHFLGISTSSVSSGGGTVLAGGSSMSSGMSAVSTSVSSMNSSKSLVRVMDMSLVSVFSMSGVLSSMSVVSHSSFLVSLCGTSMSDYSFSVSYGSSMVLFGSGVLASLTQFVVHLDMVSSGFSMSFHCSVVTVGSSSVADMSSLVRVGTSGVPLGTSLMSSNVLSDDLFGLR